MTGEVVEIKNPAQVIAKVWVKRCEQAMGLAAWLALV